MRETLLEHIMCPDCQQTFEMDVYERDDVHIIKGILRCATCQASYDIKNGIPVIIDHDQIEQKNKITAERFGQEWAAFDFIDVERYAQQFLDWIFPIQQDFFQEKLILDAGCGKGRHCIASSRFGARQVIGVDLAEGSVNAAFKNTRDIANIHIIQTNLYHLPFRQNTFDYVYSIGVLHHTPDPGGAFTCLVEKLKPKGTISAWVYGREGNWWVIHLLNPIRTSITSKLPLSFLKGLAFMLAVLLQTVLKLIYIPFNEIRMLRPFSHVLLYNDYLHYISHFPFRENYSIVFDHLLPEIAWYISKDTFASWFEKHQLENVVITRRTNNSWRGKGEKGGI